MQDNLFIEDYIEEKLKCNRYEEKSSGFSFLNASSFTNCDVNIFVNEKKNELSV